MAVRQAATLRSGARGGVVYGFPRNRRVTVENPCSGTAGAAFGSSREALTAPLRSPNAALPGVNRAGIEPLH